MIMKEPASFVVKSSWGVVEKWGELAPSWLIGLGLGSESLLQVLRFKSYHWRREKERTPTSIRVYRAMGREKAHAHTRTHTQGKMSGTVPVFPKMVMIVLLEPGVRFNCFKFWNIKKFASSYTSKIELV